MSRATLCAEKFWFASDDESRYEQHSWCASSLVPGVQVIPGICVQLYNIYIHIYIYSPSREARCTRNPDKPYDLPYDGESAPRHDLTTRVMNNRRKPRTAPSSAIRTVVFRLGPPTFRDIVALPGDNRLPVHSTRRYLCGMHRARGYCWKQPCTSCTCAFQWHRPEEINRQV